jgi:hypothetical protein
MMNSIQHSPPGSSVAQPQDVRNVNQKNVLLASLMKIHCLEEETRSFPERHAVLNEKNHDICRNIGVLL